MKVLHVIPSLNTGGAQKLLGDLLPLINNHPDIETSVVVFHKTGSGIEKILESHNIPVFSLEISSHSAKAILKLREFIKKVDIIHLHLFPANYFGVLANIGLNKPLFFTEHSTHNKRRNKKWMRPVERFFYKNLTGIICISNATKESLTNWLGKDFKSSKFHIIENGIDLKQYKAARASASYEMFGRTGIPVLMISRFTDSKDQATVVKSLDYIENKDVFIVFAGEGETMKKIRNLSISLGHEDRVIFLGNRQDIPEIIKASKIGVQSSHWEGFGLTAVEMMAGGLPVIASDVEGLRQVVEGAGLLFEKGDPEKLAEIINKILNSEKLLTEIIQKEEERVNNYSIETAANNHIQLYKSARPDL